MMDFKDVPIQYQLIAHAINVVSLWIVFTYFDKIGELLSNYVDNGQFWFVPLKFIVAYVLLQYVLPRIGLVIYTQISG